MCWKSVFSLTLVADVKCETYHACTHFIDRGLCLYTWFNNFHSASLTSQTLKLIDRDMCFKSDKQRYNAHCFNFVYKFNTAILLSYLLADEIIYGQPNESVFKFATWI